MENATAKKAIIMLSYDKEGGRYEDVIRFNGEPETDREMAIRIARGHIEDESSCDSVDLVEFEGESEEDFYELEMEKGGYAPFYTASKVRGKYGYKLEESRTARDGMPVEFNRFIAYGSGDAGIMTLYGIGRTEKEALEDSIQYGYDPDGGELALGTVELSDRAYKFIHEEGCNDMGDDRLFWDIYSNKLMLAEERA